MAAKMEMASGIQSQRVSTLNIHLVVGNNVLTDGLIEQSSIPVLEPFWLRNLLFRRMSVKNVVVAFCRRTRPYVNVHETAEKPHRSARYSPWSQTLGWNSKYDTTAATAEWSGWRSRPLWFLFRMMALSKTQMLQRARTSDLSTTTCLIFIYLRNCARQQKITTIK